MASNIQRYLSDLEPDQPAQSCELLGIFGILVQVTLAVLSIGSLVAKYWLPSEKRTPKVFCLDIWK
jgi:hypothetical protein